MQNDIPNKKKSLNNKHIPEASKVSTPMPSLLYTRNVINVTSFTYLTSLKRFTTTPNLFKDDSMLS